MSRRKRKRARREAIDVESNGGSQDSDRGHRGEIRSQLDVGTIGRAVQHPDFIFDPVIHTQLANELYLIFKNRLPGATTKDGNWTERARMTAAKVIATLASLNQKNRPRQVEHKHAHLHVDAEAVAERLARLAADVGSNGEVE